MTYIHDSIIEELEIEEEKSTVPEKAIKKDIKSTETLKEEKKIKNEKEAKATEEVKVPTELKTVSIQNAKDIAAPKTIDFRIGGGIAIPTGDFGEIYSLGFGGSASIIYGIHNQIDLVGAIDFFYFPAKDHDGRMIRVIPNVCGRYNLSSNSSPNFFGEAGFGFYYDNAKVHVSESETVIGFKLGGGFTYKKIEFLAGYQIASHEGDAHNAFIISVLYRLKK